MSTPAITASSDAPSQPPEVPSASDPSASSPAPGGCSGGATPSTLVSANEIRDIALSGTQLYWSNFDDIYRVRKQGGSSHLVTSTEDGAGLRSAGDLLYWEEAGATLLSMPTDGSAPPLQLANDLASPSAWGATDSFVYYMAPSPSAGRACTGILLKSVPGQGGDAVVLAETTSNLDVLAVDETGVYWSDTYGCTPGDRIDKYTFATASVSAFATTTGIPHSLRAAGGRLLWLDEGGVWSSPADGGDPVLLSDPPLVRGLATDGTAAYWAASAPGEDNSDIFMAPLAGGSAPRTVACQVYGIDEFWFVADESAVYYRTWTLDRVARLSTPGSAD